MSWDEERRARAGLTAVCEAASPQLVDHVARFGAVAVWDAVRRGHGPERWVRRAAAVDPDEVEDRAVANGVRLLVPGDPEWPEQLASLDGASVDRLGGAPVALWARGPGHLAQWSAESVAIVGSRASSPYGEQVATDLAIDLAGGPGGGWTVVSGGAYGIDGSAHRGACAAQGRTVAVLAGGLDTPYPRGNQPLFDQLAAEQLLVSEVPCGASPTRVGFLARNRLIAALARGTVVVEAAARSGANNTASWALECGRVLMAVPGPVHSSLSVTPHRLVRDGKAQLVCDHRDVNVLLGELGRVDERPVGGPATLFDRVAPDLMAVREVLPGRGGLSTGEIARRAGMSLPQVLAALAELQQAALVRPDETGLWRLSTPGAPGHGDG